MVVEDAGWGRGGGGRGHIDGGHIDGGDLFNSMARLFTCITFYSRAYRSLL